MIYLTILKSKNIVWQLLMRIVKIWIIMILKMMMMMMMIIVIII
jgi:hypothetical protein